MRSSFTMKCLLLAVLAMARSNVAITADAAACASPPEIVFQTEYCCTLKAERFITESGGSSYAFPSFGDRG